MKGVRADLFLGLAALVLAAGYLLGAAQIPDSMLSDTVGAAGVPMALGWVLAGLGVIICLRSILTGASSAAVVTSIDNDEAEEQRPAGLRPHAMALGLLAILAVYVALLPYVGYIVATSLLVAVVSRFSGTPFGRNLVVIAGAAGLGLWLLFNVLLSIPLPVGIFWEGL
jgi:putative tricarboxylic transport membrane protein